MLKELPKELRMRLRLQRETVFDEPALASYGPIASPGRWSQERFERSSVGRIMISLGLIATVGAWLVIGMPHSHIKAHLVNPATKYVQLIGLDQDWSVFAPYPRAVSSDVYARVEYADGSQVVWSPPARHGLITAYIDYQLLKFVQNIENPLWEKYREPFARYIAMRETVNGKSPDKVVLMMRISPSNPPGRHPARGPWSETELYTLRLQGER
jgi:hypothetical protein